MWVGKMRFMCQGHTRVLLFYTKLTTRSDVRKEWAKLICDSAKADYRMWFDSVAQELVEALEDDDKAKGQAKAKKLLQRLQPRRGKKSPLGVTPTIDKGKDGKGKKRLGTLQKTADYLAAYRK